jgi:hypothetical protein
MRNEVGYFKFRTYAPCLVPALPWGNKNALG